MSISASESAFHGKLPLRRTIGLSYSSYVRGFGNVLRISWLWLLIVAPVAGMASWLQMSWMAEMIRDLKPGIPPQMPSRPVEMAVVGNIAGIVSVVAGVSIAVAWHRYVILDERPGVSGANLASKNMWRYVGVGIVIVLIAVLPALVIGIPMTFLLQTHAGGGGSVLPNPALIVIMILVYLAAFAIVLRLSLLLPARAVEDLDLTFKEAWKHTRGNIWRMFWGIVACVLPPMLAAEIVLFGLVGFPKPGPLAQGTFAGKMATVSTIFAMCYLLILPIGIGFLSHAYRHFLRGE